MSMREPKGPRLSQEGQRERAARQDRQARALRENLAKRKAQRREREAEAGAEPGAESPGSTDRPLRG
jgi:hypothetical protein